MKNGLEDVVAAETQLSDVNGEAGQLIIRGVSLDRLVEYARYEDVALLLLDGLLEERLDRDSLCLRLGQMRKEVFSHIGAIDDDLLQLPPVDIMRALIARLADGDDLDTALRLLAAPAVFLPAILRLKRGETPVAPTPSLSQSADILTMLSAAVPGAAQVAALDTYLVTISDHGLNASTFASRVIASTKAGLTSSVMAALSALKGPPHGGAPGPVLDMLDAVGAKDNAAKWLGQALDRGERLMGFGHRIYRVRDPRADALKGALTQMIAAGQVDRDRIGLAEAVEQSALAILKERKPGRPLDVNVEFYTALLLDALTFPRDAFTGVFCHRPHDRLDRPCPRAIARRPPHPSALRLCRAAAKGSVKVLLDIVAARPLKSLLQRSGSALPGDVRSSPPIPSKPSLDVRRAVRFHAGWKSDHAQAAPIVQISLHPAILRHIRTIAASVPAVHRARRRLTTGRSKPVCDGADSKDGPRSA